MIAPNAADPAGRQVSQTELERQEGQRQAARRAARLGTSQNNGAASSVLSAWSNSSAIETGIVAATLADGISGLGPATEHPPRPAADALQAATNTPTFNHAMALDFYSAVHPRALVLGYDRGRSIPTAEQFGALTQEADRGREHVFFHVATLKAEWADPATHVKGKVTTASKDKAVNLTDGTTSHVLECPFLWGDCDADKYEGTDPNEAEAHYEREGRRVAEQVNEGLNRLGIKPFATWRSGAGWQFLIKLDQAIGPDEAENLVGKLHSALGFDPVVRNSNRILRVPGSVNWKQGKNGRVPTPCMPLGLHSVITKVDDVRNALANVVEPEKPMRASEALQIKVDWSKVNRPGWLKSVADLPDDAPAKLRVLIGHAGNLKDLNEDLIERGLLTKGYGSWSDVTHAIAAGFKFFGKYTPEQIAEGLLADLPCNQHIAKQKDKERAIERAITRSHDPKPKPDEPAAGNWPGGFNEETGKPRNDILNTVEAIKRVGITCTYDQFRCKEFWNGHADKKFDGEISDAAVTLTRAAIRRQFKFYPEKIEMQEAITIACHHNKRDPVLDNFNELKWDGKPRLDKMLHRYLGADDTPLNAAFGRKMMCAIVRRAKTPGCKYDQQIILHGPQGIRKSTFCEDLAVSPDLYTDTGDLSGSIKDQMDIIQGKQIIEFPELAGYGRAGREHNKAMVSRKVDRARLSYAHYATDTPRRSIPIATSNEDAFLNDPTGERRWWNAKIIAYDRDAFLADKDQLYAEAVAIEPSENLWLDTPELKAAHDAIVATVKAPNALVDMLADLRGEAWHVDYKDEERVSTADIRCVLGMTPADAVRSHNIGQRIADAMKALGWTKARGTLRCHKDHQPTTGYTRPLPDGSWGAPPMAHPAVQTAADVGEPEESDLTLDERMAAGRQSNSGPGHAGPTGATGATGAAGTPASTGPGPTGPAGLAGGAACGTGTTFDRLLARGMAQARADHALVRETS